MLKSSLALLSLAFLAPSALGQLSVTALDSTGFGPELLPVALAEHPDGGTASSFVTRVSGMSDRGELIIRRLDENGGLIREDSALIPNRFSTSIFRRPRGTVTSRGSTVVASEDFANQYLNSIASDGSVEWTVSVDPHWKWVYYGVWSAANGDVLVSAITQARETSFPNQVMVARYSGVTGAQLWRQERPAPFVAAARGVFQAANGAMHIAYTGGDNVAMEKVDENGQLIFQTLVSFPSAFAFEFSSFQSVAASGEFTAAFANTFSNDVFVTTVSAAGLVVRQDTIGLPNQSSAIGFGGAGGELTLVNNGLSSTPTTISRRSAAGQVIWTSTLPSEVDHVLQTIADGRGGAVLFCRTESGASLPEQLLAISVDAAGAIATTEVIAPFDVWITRVESPLIDSSGGLWVHAVEIPQLQSEPRIGLTARLSLDYEAPFEYCIPTVRNSTLQLSHLSAVGSDVVADNNLTLEASQLPAGVTLLFINAMSQGFLRNPGGSQGDLCLGGVLGRFAAPGQIQMADAQGAASLLLDLTQLPSGAALFAASAGQTLFFQGWHRDVVGGVQTSNFTGAVAVTFR